MVADQGGAGGDGCCGGDGAELATAFAAYRAKGWTVHSVHIGTELKKDKDGREQEKKAPKWSCRSWSKDPSTFKDLMNSLSIDTGRSALIVVDVDLPALEAWADIERAAGGPFDTLTVRSGSGGLHVYFKAFDDADLNKSVQKCFKLPDGSALDIDLRGKGGVIFAAPSSYKTQSGEVRHYMVERDLPVAEMPGALVACLKKMLPGASAGRRAGCGKGGNKRKRGKVGEAAAPGAEAAPWVEKKMDEDLRLEVTKYVRGLRRQRAAPFDSWQPVVFACANIAASYKFDDHVTVSGDLDSYMLTLAHTFSKKGGDAYDPLGVDTTFREQLQRFKSAPGRTHFGIPTLRAAYEEDGQAAAPVQ